jgi:hypothetical protein
VAVSGKKERERAKSEQRVSMCEGFPSWVNDLVGQSTHQHCKVINTRIITATRTFGTISAAGSFVGVSVVP